MSNHYIVRKFSYKWLARIEIWRGIPNFPNYQISTWGRIKSLARYQTREYISGGRWGNQGGKIYTYRSQELIMQGTIDNEGRQIIGLRHNKKGNRLLISRLVLLTFVGPCPKGMECCHWDGNPFNNKINNLRWGTRRSNIQDAFRHGTWPVGQQRNGKLSDDQVREARKLWATGKYQKKQITKMFNIIGEAQMGQLLNGLSYRHVK